jgi:hypothetical protein
MQSIWLREGTAGCAPKTKEAIRDGFLVPFPLYVVRLRTFANTAVEDP